VRQIFARLQKHAVPLVDDLENVLTRLLDLYEKHAQQPGSEAAPNDDIQLFSPGD